MSKTEAVIKVLPAEENVEDTSYRANVTRISQLDSTHVTTFAGPGKQKELAEARTERPHKVFRVTAAYDTFNNFDIISKEQLVPAFQKIIEGESITLIFAQNEFNQQFPEVVQYCYCKHVHSCLVEEFIEYLSRNVFDQSIVQIDVQFDVFTIRQHKLERGGVRNEILLSNVIPAQPMFPNVLVQNLPLMQRSAVNYPAILKIGLILNRHGPNKLRKSFFQVLTIPKIQRDYKKLSFKTPVRIDSMQIVNNNPLQSCYSGLEVSSKSDGDRTRLLADIIKQAHCKCLYKEKSSYLLTEKCEPDIKHPELLRNSEASQTIPHYDKFAQHVNNKIFFELETAVSRLSTEVPCYFNYEASPLLERLRESLNGKHYTKIFAFIHENEEIEEAQPLITLCQQFALVAYKQKWEDRKKKEYILIDKDEYEALKESAGQRGQLQAEYQMLEYDANELLGASHVQRQAFASRIESMKARQCALDNEIRYLRRKIQLGNELGVNMGYQCCCGRTHGHEECRCTEYDYTNEEHVEEPVEPSQNNSVVDCDDAQCV